MDSHRHSGCPTCERALLLNWVFSSVLGFLAGLFLGMASIVLATVFVFF